MIARAIHGAGDRRGKPFVAVNCGAIPDNLVESILFGHEKGAFTGATDKHIGKFVEANGGTLFLDEIGELPLRASQAAARDPGGRSRTGRCERPVKVDVRLISATNRDSLADVKNGRFREDLFYRLNVFPIAVPPLRERLRRHSGTGSAFHRPLCGRGRQALVGLARRSRCSDLPWPGNVRQLENTMFRAVVLADGEKISKRNSRRLWRMILLRRSPGRRSRRSPWRSVMFCWTDKAERPAFGSSQAASRFLDASSEVRPLEELERDIIRFAISHYRGQMSEVARRLQIGRSTLYRKLEGLGLDEQRPRRKSKRARAGGVTHGAARLVNYRSLKF